jgi:hypothetical protein
VKPKSARPRRWRWRHLFWALPLLLFIAFAVRVATYDVPVHHFVPDETPPATAGALHVHSSRSDGRRTEEEIAQEAKKAGLRFVVVTDHNVAPGPPREVSGVLLLNGTEVTTRDGHLLAYDFAEAPPPAGTPAHEAIARLRQAGAFTAVAHGSDAKAAWQRWDLRLAGMEFYNAGSDARRNLQFPYGTLIAAAAAYPINSDYSLILLHERPAEDLRRFDSLTRSRNLVGYCGLDAHGLPGYEQLFRAVRTYVHATFAGDVARDARTLWDALRAGRHHCAFELFGDGARFRFWAESGGNRVEMGDTLRAGGPVHFHATLGLTAAPEAEIALLRDGQVAATARGTTLEFEAREPGAYRVEVSVPVPTLFGRTQMESWILSNPIFVRKS